MSLKRPYTKQNTDQNTIGSTVGNTIGNRERKTANNTNFDTTCAIPRLFLLVSMILITGLFSNFMNSNFMNLMGTTVQAAETNLKGTVSVKDAKGNTSNIEASYILQGDGSLWLGSGICSTSGYSMYFYAEGTPSIASGSCGEIIVPSNITINGKSYRVTGLADGAFIECLGVSAVYLPDSVTYIGKGAFYGCKALKEIRANGATTIDELAFSYCSALNNVSFLATTDINKFAFANCTALTKVTLSSFPKVKSIGEAAFYNCKGLSSVTLAKSITSLGVSVFQADTGLSKVTFEDGCQLKSIPDRAFLQCKGLVSIRFPENIRSIGSNAFGFTSLANEVVLNEGLEIIGADSFSDSAIRRITIPSTVTIIKSSAFMNDKYLQEINFAEGSQLKTIEDYGFCNCHALKELVLPDSVESIGYSGIDSESLESLTLPNNSNFSITRNGTIECPALTELILPDNYTIVSGTITDCPALANQKNYALLKSNHSLVACNSNGTELTGSSAKVYFNDVTGTKEAENVTKTICKIFVQSGVTTIPTEAFMNYKSLQSVVLPASLTSIEQGAFRECTALTDINLSSCSKLTSLGASAFSRCYSLKRIVLPNSVTSVSEYLFEDCHALKTVTLSNNIKNIKNSAFSNCYALSEMNPNSKSAFNLPTNMKNGGIIYYEAFYQCKSITKVDLPTGGTKGITILDRAFYGTGIQELTLPADLVVIKKEAFSNCSDLKTINYNCESPFIYIGDMTVNEETWGTIFSENESLSTINFGKNAKFYNDDMTNWFVGCTALENVTLPEGSALQKMTGTFHDCTALANVNIPSGVTVLDQTFDSCSALTNITVPQSVKELTGYHYNSGDAGAFSNCSGLNSNSITFEGNGLTSVGTSAFTGCTGIGALNLPPSVKEIGENCFAGCSSLTEAYIPENMTNIPNNAFYECNNLKEVKIPDSVKEIGTYAFGKCENLNTVEFGENSQLESLWNGSFYKCQGLENIQLPDSVKNIMAGSFDYCSSLTSFDMPANLEYIGEAAFGYNDKLTDIDFSGCNKLTEIGDRAFINCTDLENLDLSNLPALKEIGDGAFYGCENLVSVDLSGCTKLETIGDSAFASSEQLTDVNLDGCSSLKNIGDDAFSDSDAVQKITKKVNVSASLNKTSIKLSVGETNTQAFTVTPGLVVLTGQDLSEYLSANPYTYQWYKTSSSTNTGGKTISGATKRSYIPTDQSVGTYYYYCKVTLSSADKTTLEKENYIVENTTVASPCAQVQVTPAAVDLSKCAITLEYGTVEFNGSKKTPNVKVTYGGQTLELNKDYTVSYSNNISVGTATVTITGTNGATDDYNVKLSGSASKTFTITKGHYNLSGLSMQDKTVLYDGEAYTIEIDGKIPYGLKVNYYTMENGVKSVHTNFDEPGTYVIYAEFTNTNSSYYNVKEVLSATLTIKKMDDHLVIGDDDDGNNTSISDIQIAGDETLQLPIKIKDDKGNESGSAGEYNITIRYQIIDEDGNAGKILDQTDLISAIYDPITGTISVTSGTDGQGNKVVIIVTAKKDDGASGTGGNQEEIKVEFLVDILEENLANIHQNLEYVAAMEPSCLNDGNIAHFRCKDAGCDRYFKADEDGNRQNVSVSRGLTLLPALGHAVQDTWTSTEKEHYKICQRCLDPIDESYTKHNFNKVEDTDASEQASVSWTRTKTCADCGYQLVREYQVVDKELILEQNNFVYTGKAIIPDASLLLQVNICKEDGEVLETKTEKILSDQFDQIDAKNCINAGKATLTISCKKYLGNQDATLTKSYVIAKAPLKSAVLSVSEMAYTGKSAKPAITVSAGLGGKGSSVIHKNIKQNTANCTIAYPKTCIKVGTYKITITGKGNFKGSISKAFMITPKKAAIKALKIGKKRILVKAKTKAVKLAGRSYQLAYMQKGTKKWKYVTSKSPTLKVFKLKKGKCYYVKLRAFTKVSGKVYYGPWSAQKLSKKVK